MDTLDIQSPTLAVFEDMLVAANRNVAAVWHQGPGSEGNVRRSLQ